MHLGNTLGPQEFLQRLKLHLPEELWRAPAELIKTLLGVVFLTLARPQLQGAAAEEHA